MLANHTVPSVHHLPVRSIDSKRLLGQRSLSLCSRTGPVVQHCRTSETSVPATSAACSAACAVRPLMASARPADLQSRARYVPLSATAGQAGLSLPDNTDPNSEDEPQFAQPAQSRATRTLHWAVSLSALYALNKVLYNVVPRFGITFPPPLIGMLCIIILLWSLDAASSDLSGSVMGAFAPAVDWVARWLPLFYVPALIQIPIHLSAFSSVELAKVAVVITAGTPLSLLVTAWVAVTIRRYASTELLPQPPQEPTPPFTQTHKVFWGGSTVVSLAAVILTSGQALHWASVAFMMAATVSGYLLGTSLPGQITQLVHPMITTAVCANGGAALLGRMTGAGYTGAMKAYLTKGAVWGAGDYLMSMLGVVILSFAFKIFKQKDLMVRHAPEIFGATTLSAAFTIYSSALGARLLGLAPELSRALIPRAVTIALALPIAQTLGAPTAIAAAGVSLTGLLGANFAKPLLNKGKFKDPIARGLATAGCAHGLGTAAIAADEPEALPFCALAYALIGVFATIFVALPPVHKSLMAITAL